jgi:hypothetical protein
LNWSKGVLFNPSNLSEIWACPGTASNVVYRELIKDVDADALEVTDALQMFD